MIETLKRHPIISGIVLATAVVGGVASFIEDLGKLWDEITKDRVPVETPEPGSFAQKNLLRLTADVPVEWVVNRGHIENWLYVIPPNADLDAFELGEIETGPGNIPYIFERYMRLSAENYRQLVPPSDQGLKNYKYISGMEEVFLGEGGWADRYSFQTAEYYVEQVAFVDYYHGGNEANPHLLELACIIPITAEDRFKNTCSRVIGSARIK